MSYIPRGIRRFDYALDGALFRIDGTVGDKPAMRIRPSGEGLLVAIHATANQNITWSEWQKFENFLLHKDLDWGLDEHDARGLSRENVSEQYSRYAKSLIAIGDGAGADIETGMVTEIVALENPYDPAVGQALSIKALYQGNPLTDVQIEVFEKSPGQPTAITFHRTNTEGVADIPIKPGHEYMLDTVVLRPLPMQTETDPSWETLWANLTFSVPAR